MSVVLVLDTLTLVMVVTWAAAAAAHARKAVIVLNCIVVMGYVDIFRVVFVGIMAVSWLRIYAFALWSVAAIRVTLA